MPRIRTIKPDFWDSPDTASADLRTRLLYIAMWNWADDYGIGDACPVRLLGFAFPNDDIPAADYPRNLADVSRAFKVVFFEHAGRPYYVIPAWDEHQRTEKRAKPKAGLLEAACEAIAAGQVGESDYPRKMSENPTLSGGSSVPGSRKGKGKREREEEREEEGGGSGGKDSNSARGSRLPDSWEPPPGVVAQMRSDHPHVDFRVENSKFADYWHDQPGMKGRKVDWVGTYRNWIRRADEQQPHARAGPYNGSAVDRNVHGWLNADVGTERRKLT